MFLRYWLFLLIGLLTACKTGVATPDMPEFASPEVVALSLSTVDPEESLSLFEYDRTATLDIQEDRRWQEGNATWIDFTYTSPKGGRVPARLVIPDGKGPFPGLILQHGGPGTLEDMVDFARAFADYGAATIMITSPYRRPGGWEITQYMGNTWPIFTDRDIEIKIQTINDLQRAVDILQARPEVDPERLAYFGVSWGASMGGLLAGVEDRLIAYVLAAGDGGLVEHTADPGADGINIHFSENWAARMWPTEPLHFVGQAAPAALLFQNGVHDTFVPPHDAMRFYLAASEPKTMIWYEAGHNLPWQFVYDAAKWLQPYLGDRLILLAPNYRPSAVFFDRIIILAVILTVGIFLWDVIRKKYLRWTEGLIWLLGMIFLGPVGLAIYWLTVRPSSEASQPDFDNPHWHWILEIATATTIALTCGFFVGNQISEVLMSADFRLRFLQFYLGTLLVGWLLTTFARKRYHVSISAQILATNLFWVIVMIFPAILNKFSGIANWGLYTLEASLGILFTYPLHAWMLSSGLERCHPAQELKIKYKRLGRPVVLGLVFFSFLAALGSVGIVVQIYTGLPWKDVIMIVAGVYP